MYSKYSMFFSLHLMFIHGIPCRLCIHTLCVSGMSGRIALTGAIFKKVLELNLTTIGQVSIGKIVNLAGYDVQRLDKVWRRKLCVYIRTYVSSPGNSCQYHLYPMLHPLFFRLLCTQFTSF